MLLYLPGLCLTEVNLNSTCSQFYLSIHPSIHPLSQKKKKKDHTSYYKTKEQQQQKSLSSLPMATFPLLHISMLPEIHAPLHLLAVAYSLALTDLYTG